MQPSGVSDLEDFLLEPKKIVDGFKIAAKTKLLNCIPILICIQLFK